MSNDKKVCNPVSSNTPFWQKYQRIFVSTLLLVLICSAVSLCYWYMGDDTSEFAVVNSGPQKILSSEARNEKNVLEHVDNQPQEEPLQDSEPSYSDITDLMELPTGVAMEEAVTRKDHFNSSLKSEEMKAASSLLELARDNWKSINAASYGISFKGSGEADWDMDICFASPFNYTETTTGWLDYEYLTDGIMENSNHILGDYTGLVAIDQSEHVYLDKFPAVLFQPEQYRIGEKRSFIDADGKERSATLVSSWLYDLLIDEQSGEIKEAIFYSRRGERKDSPVLVRIREIRYEDVVISDDSSDGEKIIARLPVAYQYEWVQDRMKWDAQIDYKGFNENSGIPSDFKPFLGGKD